MADTVKRIIDFRFNDYEKTEAKLEKLAAKGLLISACGSFMWTFKKDTPQILKYAITFFSKGSMFNPSISDEQQTYFDYAKAAGWEFVCGQDQMQIFSSKLENPIPFETDEKEKFENIKKCRGKNYLPSIIVLILCCLFNLGVQFYMLMINPLDNLADNVRLLSIMMFLMLTLYEVVDLANYLIWCKRSKQSIANGGKCVSSCSIVNKIISTVFMVATISSVIFMMLFMALEVSWIVLLVIVQIPLLIILFYTLVKYLKHKKTPATINKIVSFTILILADMVLIGLLAVSITKNGINDSKPPYRTVEWPISDSNTYTILQYNDDIPLTCEDLYGTINYKYYSYESEIKQTFFLSKANYQQKTPPEKNAPAELEYEIIDTKFDFVYNIAKAELLKIEKWQNHLSYRSIDNQLFGTMEAYRSYFDDEEDNEYLLFYKSKIVILKLADELSEEQIQIIKDKLEL